jgi:hypothetical protein
MNIAKHEGWGKGEANIPPIFFLSENSFFGVGGGGYLVDEEHQFPPFSNFAPS